MRRMNKITIGFKEDPNLKQETDKLIEKDTHEMYVIDLADGFCEYLWCDDKAKPYLYNPLVEIEIDLKREKRELRAAQKLAYALCGATDHVAAELHQAAILLSAAIIHECFTAKLQNKVPTLSNVRKDLSQDIYQTLNTWLETNHVKRKTHESVGAIAKEMLSFSPKVLDRILCNALNPLNIWLDSELNFTKKRRTKKIGDIFNLKEKPISLYIKLPNSSYQFYVPFLRAFYVQFIDAQKEYSCFSTDFICHKEFCPQIKRMTPHLSFEPSDCKGEREWCSSEWDWEAYTFPSAYADKTEKETKTDDNKPPFPSLATEEESEESLYDDAWEDESEKYMTKMIKELSQ